MEPRSKMTLQFDAEISAVITAMRQNAKWAVVPGKYNEEDHMEPEPHYEDFRMLRRKIFEWPGEGMSKSHICAALGKVTLDVPYWQGSVHHPLGAANVADSICRQLKQHYLLATSSLLAFQQQLFLHACMQHKDTVYSMFFCRMHAQAFTAPAYAGDCRHLKLV
eukprot:GHRR01015120.1.p1 GENE.GHRR01015120.1~~GHRR01015120.1.p1  ORF type:complete len:164 (+),score=55.36 GHRR01015120.1:125-616(+)